MIGTHRGPKGGRNRTGDRPAQVVVGISVAAGKLRAGEPENFLDLGGSPSLRQQVPGAPQIHNAPVGLRIAFADAPSLDTTPIDLRGCRGGDAEWGRILILRCRVGAGRHVWRRRRQGSGRVKQVRCSRGQAKLGVDDLHPGGVTARCASRGLLIGEAGESSQVTPVGAGAIASIGQRQQLACGGRHGRFQGGLLVNQTDQVQLVGHRRELPANGPQGNEESAVYHDRDFALGPNRRTMNFQRRATRVLTVCLSPGGNLTQVRCVCRFRHARTVSR